MAGLQGPWAACRQVLPCSMADSVSLLWGIAEPGQHLAMAFGVALGMLLCKPGRGMCGCDGVEPLLLAAFRPSEWQGPATAQGNVTSSALGSCLLAQEIRRS